MSADERVLSVVRGWVQKAESDLDTADLILAAGKEGTADTAAFHAQQCVEKYLKALLTYKQLDFPKTHDVGQLLLLLPRGAGIELGVEEQRRLTLYATVTRYPGEYEPVTLEEAHRAVAMARSAREQIRKALPAAVFEKLGS
ncbi:MAG TPA: HEPN domain-containing protein [Bryobacteraceae bacterium]|nr:HEPN domain-containing protein [Bryobacteraceae bacterium]